MLAIGLDDIDLAELLEALGYKRIEPGLRNFPVATLFIPVWIGSTPPADPGSVGQIKWQSHPDTVSSSSPQQDRDLLLIPDLPESFGCSLLHAGPF